MTVSSDKQLYDHMHTLFQSLRDELDVKDAELSAMKKRILEANDKDAKDMETLREAYARVLAENDNLAQAGARAQKDVDGLMRANAKIQVELDALKAETARSHKDGESRFRGLAEVLKGVCKVLEGVAEGEVEGLARTVGEVLDGAAAGGGGGGEKAKVAKHLTRLLHVAANTARGKGYYESALQELKERWGGLGGEVGVADGVVGALLEVMQGEGVFDHATADGGEEEAFVYVPIKSVLDCAAFKEKVCILVFIHCFRFSSLYQMLIYI